MTHTYCGTGGPSPPPALVCAPHVLARSHLVSSSSHRAEATHSLHLTGTTRGLPRTRVDRPQSFKRGAPELAAQGEEHKGATKRKESHGAPGTRFRKMERSAAGRCCASQPCGQRAKAPKTCGQVLEIRAQGGVTGWRLR